MGEDPMKRGIRILIALAVATAVIGTVGAGAVTAQEHSASNCNQGHANPNNYEAVYPGTDDCGFTNGEATIGSPAELPEANPHDQAPW